MEGFNALINTIQNAAPMAQFTIQTVVSGFIAAMFLRGNTQRVEFEKIKAGRMDEAIEDLVKSRELTLTELVKCNNLINIANIADRIYAERNARQVIDEPQINDKEPKEFSFDWLLRYFEAAGNVSEEEMQELWAQMLVSEIGSSGSVHPAYIDVMRNLSKKDIALLTYLLNEKQRFAVTIQFFDVYFVMPDNSRYLVESNYLLPKVRPDSFTSDDIIFSIDNLIRMGIFSSNKVESSLFDSINYICVDLESFKNEHKHFKHSKNIEFVRKCVWLTNFGGMFVNLVIKREEVSIEKITEKDVC